MIRVLSPALLGLLLGGSVFCLPAQAQPQTLRPVQWRDLTVAAPRADWNQLTTDPDPKFAGHRLLFERQEALHYGRIGVYSQEAPATLAPSEIVNQYFENQKKITSESGVLSDWKTDTRTLGGSDRPVVSVRFTPTAGTPVTDYQDVSLFPADYDQRQRYLVVQWSDQHSATTGPAPLDELDSFLGSLALKPLGTVLVADDFSDAATGAMRAFGTSDHFTAGYVDGEFAIQQTDPDWTNIYTSAVPGTFADVAVSVDAHVTSEEPGPEIYLYCRRTATTGGYRALVDPSRSRALLQQTKPDGSIVNLGQWVTSEAIQSGTNVNHLDLLCRGSLIALDINGTRVITVHNSALFEGNLQIGAGTFPGGLSETRFANLIVTQR